MLHTFVPKKMAGNFAIILALAMVSVTTVSGQFDPHFVGNRTVMVHLFEWRWNDIAEECERFLGPYGYGGVQVSPPNENVIINQNPERRPWYERYQSVSYKLETRSGTEQEFQSMVRRCNSAGVRIYVDAILNHMTGAVGRGVGTGGSSYDADSLDYPAVPYSASDFHGPNDCPTRSGDIEDFADPTQVRNCMLVGLKDLKHNDWVRDRIVDFLNKLAGYGVAGFRVDAAKHMWPEDLKAMFGRLNTLPTDQGFPSGARPFIYQEVIDFGGDPITAGDYTGHGRVCEFKAAFNIGEVIRKKNNQQLRYLRNWGEGWGFLHDGNAFVFVDNHDNQRSDTPQDGPILTFRVPRMYKMAQAFFFAWPYGITRVMSSYYWDQDFQNGQDVNNWIGPPHDSNYNILPVTINPDMTCGDGRICEHRWRQIFNMAGFRNVVKGTNVEGWWDNESNQIAFSRGNRGFIAINNDDFVLDRTFSTGLPGGIYCDVISGSLYEGTCTGKFITVGNDGSAQIYISNTDEDPVVAIHVQAKL